MRNGLPPGQEAGCHGNGGNPAGKRQPMDRLSIISMNPAEPGRLSEGDPVAVLCCRDGQSLTPGVVESARDGIVVTRCADCGARDRWGGLPTGSRPAP